jgi:isoleucyl-tRNA synthetase
VQNSPLPALGERLKNGSNVVSVTIETIAEAYNRGWKLIGNILLILSGGFGLYMAIGLLGVFNRIPLLEPLMEDIGAIVSTIFLVRNLSTPDKRERLFDRIGKLKDKIIGSQIHSERTVAAIEDSGELANRVPAHVPSPLPAAAPPSNGVDELRYLFLASQVELVEDAARLQGLQHQATTDAGKIGVTTADGAKCDRCWNYSDTVGKISEHPIVCDRCVDALAGKF